MLKISSCALIMLCSLSGCANVPVAASCPPEAPLPAVLQTSPSTTPRLIERYERIETELSDSLKKAIRPDRPGLCPSMGAAIAMQDELSHADLLAARRAQPSAAAQARLAPLEHQAFAREYATENPISALGLIPAIPMYQAAKSFGAIGSRTGSGQPLQQIRAGFRGLGQGWYNAGASMAGRVANSFSGFGAVPKPTIATNSY